jgi:hypothetical protein
LKSDKTSSKRASVVAKNLNDRERCTEMRHSQLLKKLLMATTYGLKTGWMGKVVESSFGLEDKII